MGITLLILILTLGVGLFAFFEALVDGYAIQNHTYSRRQKLSHLYNWCSRALAVGAAVVLMFGIKWGTAVMGLYAGTVFFLVFELSINWKLDRAPDAVGSNAWTDKKIRSMSKLFSFTPEFVKRLLYTAAITVAFTIMFLFSGCQRPPVPSAEFAPLPSELELAQVGAEIATPQGRFLKLNDSVALKTDLSVFVRKIKISNSFNTNNSQKKSNNTETKQKDVGNVDVGKKAVVVSGDSNIVDQGVTKDKSKVKPEGALVVGDGNTVTVPAKKAAPWWVWVPVYLLVAAIGGVVWWYWKFG